MTSYESCRTFKPVGIPSLFIHVPNTLEAVKIETIANCVLDVIMTYFEGTHHVIDESKRLQEIDDMRMNCFGPSQLFWAGLAAGSWYMIAQS